MEAQPLQSVSPADSGKGGGPKKSWDKAWTMMVEGSPSIKLGLGIGVGSRGPSPVNIKHVKSTFTHAQLQELQLQSLIFKYIVAGLPVPLHLVLPIWKSVASSFGSANGGIYKQYPSFLGCSSSCFDYRYGTELEPARCRRTDGKKWRCRRDVIPDQKYCGRHMHRGAKKHVVASKPVTVAAATISTPNKAGGCVNLKTNLSISISASPQLMTSDENSTSSSSSETTVTNSDVSHRSALSP